MMWIQRAILIVLASAVYAGLAVLGGGGIGPFFSRPARGALLVVLLASSAAAFFTDASMSAGVREDRANRWVLVVFGLAGLLSAWLPAYTDRKELWIAGNDAGRWFGVGTFAAGVVLRLWPVFALGRRFSGLVAIQPGHTLVTTGVYGVIRNPSYPGMLISAAGWALGFRSGAGWLLVLLMIPPVIARIRAEERLLAAEFGDRYQAYCARTWRLLPGVN